MHSIYETFRTYHGVVALLPEHQERLKHSCEALGVKTPDLKTEIQGVLDGQEYRFKLTVYEDGSTSLEYQVLPNWNGSFLYSERWRIKVVHGAREHADIKHGDVAFQQQERERAHIEGFDEILMVDKDGQVREGGITNVFFVDRDVLVTPSEEILPGIARALVLKACADLDLQYELRDVHVNEVDKFDAMFMTNSIRGLIATGEVLPLMQRVIDWCTDFLNKRINEGNAVHGGAQSHAG